MKNQQIRLRYNQLKQQNELLTDQLDAQSTLAMLENKDLTMARNTMMSLAADIERRTRLILERYNRILESKHEFKQESEAWAVAHENHRQIHKMFLDLKKRVNSNINNKAIKSGSKLINDIQYNVTRR